MNLLIDNYFVLKPIIVLSCQIDARERRNLWSEHSIKALESQIEMLHSALKGIHARNIFSRCTLLWIEVGSWVKLWAKEFEKSFIKTAATIFLFFFSIYRI